MKVLLIDVNYKYSSTGKIVHDLYTDLTLDGHSAAVSYGRGIKIDDPFVYKFSSDWEVYSHALLTRITGLTGRYSPLATNNLIKFIKEFKPDVVHIHELHAYFVNIGPLLEYFKSNNIRTVWTFHCEFMYTGKCGHAYDCEKWKTECGNCPQVKEYPSSLYFDFTKKMFNEKKKWLHDFNNLTIVAPSNWLANRVRESFLGDKEIKVIHNGIDTSRVFYPRDYEGLKKKHNITDEKIVLAVAPDLMSEQKGGRWVFELAKRFKNEKMKFILIGVEDFKNMHVDENVIALGRTQIQDELAEYYSMADLFVICSKRENFPTTCIESISCGTPVIGFDEGGAKETAPAGFGSFVPYGNLNLMEQEIRSFFEGTRNFHSSEVCSKYGRENYDKSIMYKKYKELYDRVSFGVVNS